MPLVLGVLVGFTKRIELSGHGKAHDKGFVLEDQGSKFFMSLRVRDGGTFALPVLPKDTFAIMTMVFSQIRSNAPGLSDAQLMAFTRRVCEKTDAAAWSGGADKRVSNA